MEISLAGRTAVITGASKGLGLAMATRFAASGADVAMLARRPDVLDEAKAIVGKTAKGRVAVFSCDVAKAPRAGGAPTAVSRAAGMALTKALAGEYAPHNVLVNALLVGLIVSDQWVRRHAAQGANIPFEEFTAKMAGNIPLGRMGKAEEFANIACFLASDAAAFVTGTAINVDGGASPVV